MVQKQITFFIQKIGGTHCASTLRLVLKDPIGFLILTKFSLLSAWPWCMVDSTDFLCEKCVFFLDYPSEQHISSFFLSITNVQNFYTLEWGGVGGRQYCGANLFHGGRTKLWKLITWKKVDDYRKLLGKFPFFLYGNPTSLEDKYHPNILPSGAGI